jgi:hypothetical protein
MIDDIQISNLKLATEVRDKKEPRYLPHHKPGENFLKGPVPQDWLACAAKQPGKAFHVGVAIWFQAGIVRSRKVKLSHKALRNWGIKRNTAYRAIAALEKAKLISVDRHRGRNPVVIILAIMKQESEAL